ncbi:MAG: hypothetical protein ACR2GV_04745, partial [Gaiellaceae bacterium]
ESRHFLLGAAALSHPRVALVEAATGVSRGAGLSPALETRIVEVEGDRIRPRRPAGRSRFRMPQGIVAY